LLFGTLVFAGVMEGRRALVNSIARERIEILFGLAERNASSEPGLALSYITIIEKMRSHYKIGLPLRIKNRICKGCSTVLMPGLNCTAKVASSKGYVIYKCKRCGAERHLRYKNMKSTQK